MLAWGREPRYAALHFALSSQMTEVRKVSSSLERRNIGHRRGRRQFVVACVYGTSYHGMKNKWRGGVAKQDMWPVELEKWSVVPRLLVSCTFVFSCSACGVEHWRFACALFRGHCVACTVDCVCELRGLERSITRGLTDRTQFRALGHCKSECLASIILPALSRCQQWHA